MNKKEAALFAIIGILVLIIFGQCRYTQMQNRIIATQNETMKTYASTLDSCNAEADKYFNQWIDLCRDVIADANK